MKVSSNRITIVETALYMNAAGYVLAHKLSGVDWNEGSVDYACLIPVPHYTGSDYHEKIINGGWKKAVGSKGKNFFLCEKFYNLLLPQRPNKL